MEKFFPVFLLIVLTFAMSRLTRRNARREGIRMVPSVVVVGISLVFSAILLTLLFVVDSEDAQDAIVRWAMPILIVVVSIVSVVFSWRTNPAFRSPRRLVIMGILVVLLVTWAIALPTWRPSSWLILAVVAPLAIAAFILDRRARSRTESASGKP